MRAVRAGAGALGEDVLKRSYHSPVVHPNDLPPDVFERRDPMHGIAIDLGQQVALLSRLKGYLHEFTPPVDFFENIMYGSLDAEVLYAFTRHLQPKRIIELGSGSTSIVMDSANVANASDGFEPADLSIFDPSPSPLLATWVKGPGHVQALRPEQIDRDRFEQLQSNDVLFVDTTHTVKVGSEVNYIILEILPLLASGVYVHFHDIFLPYNYPEFYLDQHLFYVEQYLLQAFLAFNPNYEVVFCAHAIARQHPDAMLDAIPSAPRGLLPAGPSSFWIRRI